MAEGERAAPRSRKLSPVQKVICYNLRAKRMAMGLDQARLAKKLGMAQASYCQFETGRRSPRLDTLEKLARALRTSVLELVTPPDRKIYDDEI